MARAQSESVRAVKADMKAVWRGLLEAGRGEMSQLQDAVAGMTGVEARLQLFQAMSRASAEVGTPGTCILRLLAPWSIKCPCCSYSQSAAATAALCLSAAVQ